MDISGILPFLAALKKQVPDAGGSFVGENNVPGSTATGSEAAWTPDSVNKIPTNPQMLPEPMGPPAAAAQPPPDSQPNAQPDMSIGAGQQPGLGDITNAPTGKAAAPKLSKGTQLLMMLKGGLMGGLAGMAQNAETYAQTGRNAGFGGGFFGAQQLPFMQAYQRGQLAQQQAQTELTRQQAQEINVPGYGSMPAGLAKVLFPSLIKGQATIGAAELGKQGRIGAAEVGKSVVVVPGKGMYQKDSNGNYQPVEGAQLPNVLVTSEEAQNLGHPELANQELPMAQYSQLLRGVSSQNVPVQGAAGPSLVNKNTGQTRGLGLGSPGVAVAMARPVQVADPNNPGNVTYQSAGQAIGQGGMSPQSAPAVTAKATARAVAPGGKVGEEINAFNTAIQHADLLQKAGEALHNGDIQTLNSLKNRFANEFGATGPITANTIAQAYTREISKMLTSGHMTDSEIGAVGSTLDPNRQSLPQMMGVLQAYKSLAASKMQVRQQGVAQGMQGKANFTTPQEPSATGPDGHKIVFRNGAWVDAATDQRIQ